MKFYLPPIFNVKCFFHVRILALLALFGFFATQNSFGQVSGKVYHDFNANGSQQSSNPYEPSIAGATVTAFLPDGSSVIAVSDVNGNYSFTAGQLPNGTQVRLEFTSLPNQSNETSVGGTLVQFITAGVGGSNKDLGVAFPNDYCQSNPTMVTPCYTESGDSGLDIVVKFSYENEGTAPGDETAITHSQMAGSLWGMSYSKFEKLLYAAAVLKTHIPLGTAGLDAIYTIDPFSGSPNATLWLELTDDLGIAVSSTIADPQYLDNTTRGVNTSPQNDAQAFVDVGKVGIGDIDLSADEKTLYVINLFDKKLYAIDVATKTVLGSYSIPNPGCTNGEARPWAIGEYEGSIFVGVTCDGSSSGVPSNLTDNSGVNNLSATIYRLDGASFTQVLTTPLNYPKENPFEYSGGCDAVENWKPWADVLPTTCADGEIGYPTPLLTDIEFDDNGNMILGFTDRTGFQFGYDNYGPSGTTLYSVYVGGDILRACKNSSAWVIESVANGCTNSTGSALNTTDATGYVTSGGSTLSKHGEFYEGDYFHGDGGAASFDNSGMSWFPGHPENTIGGLTVVPGTGEVMTTSYDPVTGAANYNTGGVITLSNSTGRRVHQGYQLYATGTGGVTQGKGVGLGDLEALCDARTVEIHTRVWNDTDEDGIQDPNEAAIGSVCFEIFADFDGNGVADGAALGATSTNASGELFFTTSNVADGDPNTAGNQAGPQVGKKYILKVCSTDWAGGEGTAELLGLAPTTANSDGTANGDYRDSDATLVSSTPQISVSTALTGATQYVLGAGFKTAPVCTSSTGITLSQTAATCSGPLPSNNGSIQLTAATDADKWSISTFNAGTYDGDDYANANNISLPQTVQTNIPNAGGTYILRIFNGADDCFVDTLITVATVTCTPCPTTTYPICAGESYTLTADAGLTDYQWYVISGTDTMAISSANAQSYIANAAGTYYWTALDGASCLAQLCCPVSIVDSVCCVLPTGITFSQASSTCTDGNANNDGSISLDAVSDADKFGVSSLNASSYDGSDYASANAIVLFEPVAENIPNTGGSYIIRIFNGSDDCFVDTTITVAPVCCPTSSNLSANICEGTTYFFDGQNLSIAGIYQDTLTNAGGCDSILVLTLTVQDSLSAGAASGSPLTICSAASGLSVVDLYNLLADEDPGGTWTDESGTPAGANFNAAAGTLDPNGLAVGTYIFEYTQNNSAPCDPLSAQVSVVIENCCPPKICLPVSISKN